MIHAHPSCCPCVQLFIKTLQGKTLTLDLPMAASKVTVQDLMEKLQEVDGTALDQQHLVFAGKMLDKPQRTLESYGLQKECTIHMVQRLKGC
jgi:hypothetical protein